MTNLTRTAKFRWETTCSVLVS